MTGVQTCALPIYHLSASILEKNKYKKIKRLGTGENNTALLTGILKCSKCGSNMIIKQGHKSKTEEGKRYDYYVCSKKEATKKEISSKSKKIKVKSNTNIKEEKAVKKGFKNKKSKNKDKKNFFNSLLFFNISIRFYFNLLTF